jgi:very-short-patch-repair endonuclease
MRNSDELLVGIVNLSSDFEIIRNQLWYRIPVDKAQRLLKKRWPPKWIAFYYTKKIEEFPHMIIHYAKISSIIQLTRKDLFPNEKENYKSQKKYYKITFDKLLQLPQPIFSRRWRRIVFIQTTYDKFIKAVEINDLFDGSTLEDRLWAELKRNGISADRQEVIKVDQKYYFLDFAIYCKNGKIDIETDGDLYHHNLESAAKDNVRNNDLTYKGWNIVRFNSNQINEKMETYCLPTIKTLINKLGGIDLDKSSINRLLKLHPDLLFKNYFEEYD